MVRLSRSGGNNSSLRFKKGGFRGKNWGMYISQLDRERKKKQGVEGEERGERSGEKKEWHEQKKENTSLKMKGVWDEDIYERRGTASLWEGRKESLLGEEK